MQYPFLSMAYQYLEEGKNLYSEATLKELYRRYRRMNKDLIALKDRGLITSEDPRRLTEDDVSKYIGLLKARGVKENGLAHNLAAMHRVCLYNGNNVVGRMKVRWGKLMPRKRTRRLPSMPPEDVTAIVAASEAAEGWREIEAFALVLLAIHAGPRTKELRLAAVGDIDTRRWTLAVRHPKGEGSWGQEREAPILPPARPMLKRYLKARADAVSRRAPLNDALFPALRDGGDGHLSTNGVEELKQIVARKTGVEFDLRACRRTFGQMLIDRDVRTESVSVAMGHATTKTTETYYARKRQDRALQEIFSSYEAPAPGAETP